MLEKFQFSAVKKSVCVCLIPFGTTYFIRFIAKNKETKCSWQYWGRFMVIYAI